MQQKPFFTVFVPTYNRAYILERTLLSCNESTYQDFEVLLVDDGSSDNTQDLLPIWKKKLSYPIRCFKQKNSGKHVAHNLAVANASGFLFLTLDSDDKLLPNALQEVYDAWVSIEEDCRDDFASVEGRCLEEGIATSPYPKKYFDSSYLEMKNICPTKGEKRSAYRLDVLKKYLFPVFEGERYCRPGLIEMRMAHEYRTRFANIILIDVGHEQDGICANRRKVVIKAPKAYRQYFLEEITANAPYNPAKDLKSYYKRYIRSSLNAGVSLIKQFNEVPNKVLWFMSVPEGWVGSVADKIWKRKNIK